MLQLREEPRRLTIEEPARRGLAAAALILLLSSLFPAGIFVALLTDDAPESLRDSVGTGLAGALFAILLVAFLVTALLTRRRQFVFSKVAGTLVVSKRAFILGGRRETIPMTDLVSVAPRAGPPRTVEVIRNDGRALVVYEAGADADYQRALHSVAAFVGAPINRGR